jgi:opacity protein-like surface antigen
MHSSKRPESHIAPRALLGGLALLILIPAVVCAQSTGEPFREDGEFSVYTGAAFGPLGGHPTVGGTTGVFFSKYAGILVDGSFIPLGSRTLVRHPLLTQTSRLYDINVATHIQRPIKRRWAPYGLLSADLLYNPFRIEATNPSGVVYFRGTDDVKFGVSAGAGARYFIREDWGVKGEFRYTVSTQNFSRLLFGVFYRVPSNWP